MSPGWGRTLTNIPDFPSRSPGTSYLGTYVSMFRHIGTPCIGTQYLLTLTRVFVSVFLPSLPPLFLISSSSLPPSSPTLQIIHKNTPYQCLYTEYIPYISSSLSLPFRTLYPDPKLSKLSSIVSLAAPSNVSPLCDPILTQRFIHSITIADICTEDGKTSFTGRTELEFEKITLPNVQQLSDSASSLHSYSDSVRQLDMCRAGGFV